MNTTGPDEIIHLEDGWKRMQEGMDKFTEIMENDFRESFTNAFYLQLYQ